MRAPLDPPVQIRDANWTQRGVAARLCAQHGALEPDEGGSGYAIATASAFQDADRPAHIPAGYLSGLRRAIQSLGHAPAA
jgi:hypothetical protein